MENDESFHYLKMVMKKHQEKKKKVFYNEKTGQVESTKEEQKITKDYWFPEENDADI